MLHFLRESGGKLLSSSTHDTCQLSFPLPHHTHPCTGSGDTGRTRERRIERQRAGMFREPPVAIPVSLNYDYVSVSHFFSRPRPFPPHRPDDSGWRPSQRWILLPVHLVLVYVKAAPVFLSLITAPLSLQGHVPRGIDAAFNWLHSLPHPHLGSQAPRPELYADTFLLPLYQAARAVCGVAGVHIPFRRNFQRLISRAISCPGRCALWSGISRKR